MAFTALLLLVALPLSALEIGYVHRGIASAAVDRNIAAGTVFTDGEGSVAIARKNLDGAVIFDVPYTVGTASEMGVLDERGPVVDFEAGATVWQALVQASVTVKGMYPFSPVASLGFSWDGGLLAMAGLRYSFQLSRIASSPFTLLDDASIEASASAGVMGGGFAVLSVISYTHRIGSCRWSLGCAITEDSQYISASPVLLAGVSL